MVRQAQLLGIGLDAPRPLTRTFSTKLFAKGTARMGMIELNVRLVMHQSRAHDFARSRLLTIGKQGIDFTLDELRDWAKQSNFALDESHLVATVTEKNPLTDNEFFRSLGFLSVDSMDCNEYEGASIICNLNKDIPNDLHNRFDVIFDGGSTEHVFNVPKAFENYNKMLKVGGLVIHSLPSTGCLDHGFYMFSPTLLYDYYSQNRWEIVDFYMISVPYESYSPWTIYKYDEPGPSLEDVEFRGRWGIFFIARKREESTSGFDIEQHFFKKLWQNKLPHGAPDNPDHTGTGLLRRAYRMLPEKFRRAARPVLIKTRKLFPVKKVPFRRIDLLR
jgi:SAM-dependent methyltransferase